MTSKESNELFRMLLVHVSKLFELSGTDYYYTCNPAHSERQSMLSIGFGDNMYLHLLSRYDVQTNGSRRAVVSSCIIVNYNTGKEDKIPLRKKEDIQLILDYLKKGVS